MAKMMTQLDLLSKHVTIGGRKDVNAVCNSSGMSPDEAQFETMYNEEVIFLSNQVCVGGGGGSHLSYPRSSGNQG
ncbi:hypothetical protein MTR67_022946 [Solanum verrucosum]|uniref:Uncharacterized protein n=1 Tax=Solanum verrucosum TaxID=315347 RepID=A0AAF0QZY7_SOLVR|nr:hypothetical protein MTR67_022946 [Solanum verrucosum]